MFKPEPKYSPTKTFSVAEDGFYGIYYEPKENLFPGKGMVFCTGSDGSFPLARPVSSVFFRVERRHRTECDANREQSWQDTLDFLQNTWRI